VIIITLNQLSDPKKYKTIVWQLLSMGGLLAAEDQQSQSQPAKS
jgi:hypothetical protein